MTRRVRPVEPLGLVGTLRRACWAALLAAAAATASAEAPRCSLDVVGEVRAVERALGQQAFDQAVERAEVALTACPDEAVLTRLLARAYEAAGNSGRARELLREHLADHPLDCESFSMLAWSELHANRPAETWQALLAPGCPATLQEAGRWAVLEALAYRYVDDRPAEAAALARLSDSSPLWPEDDLARGYLEHQRDPQWVWPFEMMADLAVGGTTNAYAGSPTDINTTGVESLLGRALATATLRSPPMGVVTPLIEATIRGHGIGAEQARELSYLELGGRAGVEVRLGGTRVVVAARREVLHLNQATSLFSAGWRGELDLETAGGVVLFAGGGHRDFHDPWRTRREWDGGAAASLRVGGAPVTVAVSGRRFDATRHVYDQRGASLTAVTRLPLGGGWLARVSLQGSWDDYPHSDTWEGLIAFGSDEGRRDLTARLSVGAWRQLRPGLQAAVTYEHGRRWSTIEEGFLGSFSYREDRVLASLRLDLSGNPWRRGRASADHVRLDYGLGRVTPGVGDERIRDLVRQDEELRGDCGCTGF